MEITLEVQTDDAETLVPALLGADTTGDAELTLGDGVSMRYLGIETGKAIDALTLVLFALSFPLAIATNVIADMIGEYLRRHRQSSRIDKVVLEIIDVIESTDDAGNKVTKRTTRREEIPIKI